MKIVSVLNQKGGCGKTTISINIAHSLSLSGAKVLLVDADPQASSRDWDDKNKGKLLHVVRMDTESLPEDLAEIDGFDWIIIDGAPRLTPLIEAAVSVSDMVLIPIQPSALDIWACIELVDLVLKTQNNCDGDPKAAFIISRKVNNANTTKEATEALEQQKIPLFLTGTTQRVIYAATLGKGKTIFSTPINQSAAKEVNMIKDELIGRLIPGSQQSIELNARLKNLELKKVEVANGI